MLSKVAVLASCAVVLATASASKSDSSSDSSSSSAGKVTITGNVYADNYFELYFNGKLVFTDPYSFIPHQAVDVSFEAPASGTYSFAILATDFADDVTGLEYNDLCVGDGGLRAMFDDGTVTNADWKCYTYFYGPTNPEECFADTLHGWDQDERFTPATCRVWDTEVDAGSVENCNSVYSDIDEDWTKKNFDDSDWDYATEHDEVDVGWGRGVTQERCVTNGDNSNYDDPNCRDPTTMNWADSEFIWRPNLNYDNRILCRYSYTRE